MMQLKLSPEASAKLAQKKAEQAAAELASANQSVIDEFDTDGSIGLQTFVDLGFRLTRTDQKKDSDHYSWVAILNNGENDATCRATRTPVMKYTRYSAHAQLKDGDSVGIILRSPVDVYDMADTKKTYDKLCAAVGIALS